MKITWGRIATDPPIEEFDTIEITGRIVSESGKPRVEKLRGVVGTISPAGEEPAAIKVWPVDDNDPQLPKEHNGKLWFWIEEAEIVLIDRAE